LSRSALELLSRQTWPGNVRELENAVQRAVALATQENIDLLDLSSSVSKTETEGEDPVPAAGMTVREMERQLIQRTLQNTGGNRTHAARILGISLRTLRNKLNEFGLQDRQARFAQSRVS